MYDIEAVRAQWIGRTSSRRRAKYPVEHEPIRRHCLMVGNKNPLYIEPGYASRTPCPPTALWIFSMVERLGPQGPKLGKPPKEKSDDKPEDSPFSLGMPMIGSQFTNMGR